MGGIVDRLRALLGGGQDEVTEISTETPLGNAPESGVESAAVRQERAIDSVNAAREAAQVDAFLAITDTPGSVDGRD